MHLLSFYRLPVFLTSTIYENNRPVKEAAVSLPVEIDTFLICTCSYSMGIIVIVNILIRYPKVLFPISSKPAAQKRLGNG
jgi:hypothetical protein